jgi:gamma-butyrobetaine dioxygenase
LLHCLKANAIGGANYFVDGFMIAEMLRRKKPDEFKTLTTVKATYHKLGKDHSMYFRRTMIDIDENEEVIGINFSPPFEGPLRVPFHLVEKFYHAYRSFVHVSRNRELQISYRLIPGDIISFNNRRVLHARAGFDPNSGERHLRGIYFDHDDYFSIYRKLLEKYPLNPTSKSKSKAK